MNILIDGHTAADVCTAVEFIYERILCQAHNAPTLQLWESVDQARPIVRFAHKFDMTIILEECDECLSAKVRENLQPGGQSPPMFSSRELTIAWAALAEQCSLGKLLACSELFMAMMTDGNFWAGDNSAVQHLSQASLLRILTAARTQASAQVLGKCKYIYQSHVCKYCSLHLPNEQVVNVNHLMSWQSAGDA